jgi:hypothetical protein
MPTAVLILMNSFLSAVYQVMLASMLRGADIVIGASGHTFCASLRESQPVLEEVDRFFEQGLKLISHGSSTMRGER